MSHAPSTAHTHLSRDTKPVGVCHGCDSLRTLAATSPAVASALSVLATIELGNTEFAVVSRWDQLLEWVADDHEARNVEIHVSVAGITYPENDSVPGAVTTVEYSYRVEASDTWLYGDASETYTFVNHSGSGPNLETAADACLKMIAEFWNQEADKAARAGFPTRDEVRE